VRVARIEVTGWLAGNYYVETGPIADIVRSAKLFFYHEAINDLIELVEGNKGVRGTIYIEMLLEF
jgi:hypothetical protein